MWMWCWVEEGPFGGATLHVKPRHFCSFFRHPISRSNQASAGGFYDPWPTSQTAFCSLRSSFPVFFLLSKSCALTTRIPTVLSHLLYVCERERKGVLSVVLTMGGEGPHTGTRHGASVMSRPQRTLSTLPCLWSGSDHDVLENSRQRHWGWRGNRFSKTGSRKSGLQGWCQKLFLFFWCPPSKLLLVSSSPCSHGEAKAISFRTWNIFCVRKEGVAVPGWVNSGLHPSPPTGSSICFSTFCPVHTPKNS